MMENLIQENSELKLELEACYQKVAKSQKVSMYGWQKKNHQRKLRVNMLVAARTGCC